MSRNKVAETLCDIASKHLPLKGVHQPASLLNLFSYSYGFYKLPQQRFAYFPSLLRPEPCIFTPGHAHAHKTPCPPPATVKFCQKRCHESRKGGQTLGSPVVQKERVQKPPRTEGQPLVSLPKFLCPSIQGVEPQQRLETPQPRQLQVLSVRSRALTSYC